MSKFDTIGAFEFLDSEVEKMNKDVFDSNVIHIQKEWGEWIILIGKIYKNNGNYISTIKNFLNEMYSEKNLLFKPTMAIAKPFRKTKKECESYFVGGDIIEDEGFALSGWETIKWFNHGIIHKDNISIAMGHYVFQTKETEIKADYTFVYEKDDHERLKIISHHSSLPISC